MAVVNRVARGFLSFFDAKTGGNLPNDIAREVSPGIEMWPFYAADIPITQSLAVNVGINGQFVGATITIPDTETWIVYDIGCRVTNLDAANDAAAAITYVSNKSAFRGFLSDSVNVKALAQVDGFVVAVDFGPMGRLFNGGTVLESFNLTTNGGLGFRHDFAVSHRTLSV